MIKPYKNRELKVGQKVEVYRNLHNGLFSIKDAKTGYVLAHGEDFTIKNAVVKLSKNKQNLVRESQQRNVHAFLVGELVVCDTIVLKNEITYNPYEHEGFVFKKDGKQFMGGKLVYFNNAKCFLVEELNNVQIEIVDKND